MQVYLPIAELSLNVVLLLLNLPLIGLWTRLLDVPKPLLMGAVVVFSMAGAYTVNNSAIDLVIVFALGCLSFVMRYYEFPVAPAILGIVLGPLIEQEFRRSPAISVGDPSIFVTRPVSAAILLIAAVVFVAGVRSSLVRRIE